ncbi:DUF4266 domain-containing protein [Polyangium sp. 6x1]|uniref:DUF4266 domain-containing protein n=1 Tax=Polyangium sp. 6x1 TaxID=3042689 RepID=UPI0024830ED9|nr:DUF4266 domain-containing protein [Polyangium sp. 6x1]MDI1443494.1 DUF4266 domain-containing protein [Polyangium sp. 6x1]
MVLRTTQLACLLVLLCGLAACTHVAPYERGRLAHPTMSVGPVSGPGESHMQAVHEGASGGSASAEGGCGCN